jgi:hypothetical protein
MIQPLDEGVNVIHEAVGRSECHIMKSYSGFMLE